MIVHSVKKTQPVEPVEPVVRCCNARTGARDALYNHGFATGQPVETSGVPLPAAQSSLPADQWNPWWCPPPPNVRPHEATVSDEERQHRPPDHAGHAFALEAKQDLQTILRAHFDALQLALQSLAILVEGLGSPDEVALSSGWHCFRNILDSCNEGATCRLEVVDARDARQIQPVATAHPHC